MQCDQCAVGQRRPHRSDDEYEVAFAEPHEAEHRSGIEWLNFVPEAESPAPQARPMWKTGVLRTGGTEDCGIEPGGLKQWVDWSLEDWSLEDWRTAVVVTDMVDPSGGRPSPGRSRLQTHGARTSGPGARLRALPIYGLEYCRQSQYSGDSTRSNTQQTVTATKIKFVLLCY